MKPKQGYKERSVGMIPEDWEVLSLGERAIFKTGPFGSALHKSDYIEDGTPWINPIHIVDGQLIPDSKVTITTEAANLLQDFRLRHNDIIIARRGDMGRCAVVQKDQQGWICGSGSMIIRCTSQMVPDFVQRILASPRAVADLENASVGSTMNNLNQTVLSDLKIQCPPLPEQEAIAEALADVDALLAALDKLIAKKRAIKQAAMQQLLTGKTRLPGFTGDWVHQSVGEFAQIGRGRVISHQEINRSSAPTYPVYSSQTSNNGIMGYLDTYDFEGEYITWTTDGANAGKVFYRRGRFNCTNVCGTLKLRTNDPKFVALALDTVARDYVSINLANPKLMNGVMKQINLLLPASVEEQVAIATILSDMDAEITALEKRRDKTQQIKQGMMQQLLTGRIRLIDNEELTMENGEWRTENEAEPGSG
jgi:type I restriction enzyme S subunit